LEKHEESRRGQGVLVHSRTPQNPKPNFLKPPQGGYIRAAAEGTLAQITGEKGGKEHAIEPRPRRKKIVQENVPAVRNRGVR